MNIGAWLHENGPLLFVALLGISFILRLNGYTKRR